MTTWTMQQAGSLTEDGPVDSLRSHQGAGAVAAIEVGHHLDTWSVRHLWRITRELLAGDRPPNTISLDMAGTWTIDSEGLTFVDQLARQCAAEGRVVLVTDSSWEIRKVLVDAGLTDEGALDAGGHHGAVISPRSTRLSVEPPSLRCGARYTARDAMYHDPSRLTWSDDQK